MALCHFWPKAPLTKNEFALYRAESYDTELKNPPHVLLKRSSPNMTDIVLKGIFPPIPTPFEDGKPAYGHLAQNVEKWIAAGVDGFVVLGSNGEYPLMRFDEKLQTVATVARTAPAKMPVIAGTGCESTAETIRLTAACADAGAKAALVVTPHYYGGKMTHEAITRHYEAVADASPVPILLYNVPKFTHINLAPEVVTSLSAHPNICGIKDSAGNVAQLGEYLNRSTPGFQVLVGTAGALYGALSLGCCGGILALANVAPGACVEILRAAAEGRHDVARQLQLRMLPVNQAVTATFGIPGIKAALDFLGYFGGDPRLPLLPATTTEREQIRQILSTAGLL
jgi:4-hydroxy-2-oxoglutarate aldolase